MHAHTALYLKQYFENFNITQKHTQTLNLLHTCLQVLQNLVSSFMEEHRIPDPPLHTPYAATNDKLQISLEDGLMRVYAKVGVVFQWVTYTIRIGQEQEQRSHGSMFSSRSIVCQDDEQLYQILNQYKKTNKTLKQNLEQATKKNNQKQQQVLNIQKCLQNSQKSVATLTHKASTLQQQIITQHQHLLALQSTNNQLQTRITQLEHQLQVLQQERETERSKVQELENQQNRYREREDQERKRIRDIEEQGTIWRKQVQDTIARKLGMLDCIVQGKLRDQQLWKTGVVQELRKFAIYSKQAKNKQNHAISVNQKQNQYQMI